MWFKTDVLQCSKTLQTDLQCVLHTVLFTDTSLSEINQIEITFSKSYNLVHQRLSKSIMVWYVTLTYCPFFSQQLRKLVLEIIHRIPTNEHLRPHTKNVLSVMFRFLEVRVLIFYVLSCFVSFSCSIPFSTCGGLALLCNTSSDQY